MVPQRVSSLNRAMPPPPCAQIEATKGHYPSFLPHLMNQPLREDVSTPSGAQIETTKGHYSSFLRHLKLCFMAPLVTAKQNF